jgi:hypothetical protein
MNWSQLVNIGVKAGDAGSLVDAAVQERIYNDKDPHPQIFYLLYAKPVRPPSLPTQFSRPKSDARTRSRSSPRPPKQAHKNRITLGQRGNAIIRQVEDSVALHLELSLLTSCTFHP